MSSIKINVHVVPNASRQKIEFKDGFVKVWVKSVAKDGKANKELLEYVAKVLGVGKKDVEIVSGHKSRKKVLLVRGLDDTNKIKEMLK